MPRKDTLFGPSSSPERKFWGFLVFKKALGRVDSTGLPMLFTKNFMRCWINHLSEKDRYLHKISLDVVRWLSPVYYSSMNDFTLGQRYPKCRSAEP